MENNNSRIKNIIISPPFGAWINRDWATSVIGTYTPSPRKGKWLNIFKTLRPTRHGWINKIGLRNPGLSTNLAGLFHAHEQKYNGVIFSFHGNNTAEWTNICDWLRSEKFEHSTIEMNISCPNVDKITVTPSIFYIFAQTFVNTIVKLPPTDDAYDLFQTAWNTGISYFHCCNTLPTENGGESGGQLKPYSLKLIEQIKNKHPDACVIGGGGIYIPQDVIDYKNAGADKISIATAWFTPWKIKAIREKAEELF